MIPLQYQALLLSDDRRMSAFADAITHAVRVVTKNLLSLLFEPPGSIDWTTNYLVVPRREPVEVLTGDEITVLAASLSAGSCTMARAAR